MMNPDEFLRAYAAQLEREHGPCMRGQGALLKWLDQRVERLARLHTPGHAAMEIASNEYLLWQGEVLGMDAGG